MAPASHLHDLEGRPARALRHGPVDVLRGHLDAAALAVHAVLRVDDELLVLVVLVDAGGTEAALRRGVLLEAPLGVLPVAHGRAIGLDAQVRGLVVLVVRARALQVGEQVEADDAVGLGVLDGLVLGRRLRLVRVPRLVLERPGLLPARDHRAQARVHHARGEAALEGRVAVAHAVELLVHPAAVEVRLVARGLEALLVRVHLEGLADALLEALRERLEGGLGEEHARLEREVRALDLDGVERAGAAAGEGAAREGELGQRVQAALVEHARAVGDAGAALDVLGHVGVVLPALELLVGVEVRVLVVQAHDDAHEHQIGLHVVEEGAAEGLVHEPGLQRVADGVLHEPGLDLVLGHLPDLLDAEAVGLLVLALAQAELLDDLLGAAAAAALGEERLPRVQLDAALEGVLHGAVLGDAHVARGHAHHAGAGRVVEHLGGGEAGVDLHPELLGLAPQPAHELRQADDVVAVVVELLGVQHAGDGHAATALVEPEELVLRDLGGDGHVRVLAPLRQ
mmetsp:Transcript_46268/g.144739  ORF Transcript_46268/g.144739 Transcript_46268/m.144739 type:complete len:512 (-) Transcript_46268:298-1833(-)